MATKKVKLWCEEGEHWWKRDSQRGRPPFNCPKHAPVKEKREPVIIELWCEEGEHIWDWVKRGFEPINCPQHRPVKEPAIKQVELICETGNHKWLWTVQRGRRPRRCPEHRAISLTNYAASNGRKEPKGLGAIKHKRKRAAMNKMRSRYYERQRTEALAHVDTAAERYEAALQEEREVFIKLDSLESRKFKTPKVRKQIQELKEEWNRKWRKVNNMYNTLHTTISSHRHMLP